MINLKLCLFDLLVEEKHVPIIDKVELPAVPTTSVDAKRHCAICPIMTQSITSE
jgi:hypothetical protein